jgi:hypothetical protein
MAYDFTGSQWTKRGLIGNEYGGVELSYFGKYDPFTALFVLEETVDRICHSGDMVTIKKTVDTFIKKSKKNFYSSGLQDQSGELVDHFFGKLNYDGELILGNNVVSQTSGEPYATHLEYGFVHKGSTTLVGPYNFMRPAVREAIDVYKKYAGLAASEAAFGVEGLIASSMIRDIDRNGMKINPQNRYDRNAASRYSSFDMNKTGYQSITKAPTEGYQLRYTGMKYFPSR